MGINVIEGGDRIWTLMSPKGGDPVWTLNVMERGDPIWVSVSPRGGVTPYGP